MSEQKEEKKATSSVPIRKTDKNVAYNECTDDAKPNLFSSFLFFSYNFINDFRNALVNREQHL